MEVPLFASYFEVWKGIQKGEEKKKKKQLLSLESRPLSHSLSWQARLHSILEAVRPQESLEPRGMLAPLHKPPGRHPGPAICERVGLTYISHVESKRR